MLKLILISKIPLGFTPSKVFEIRGYFTIPQAFTEKDAITKCSNFLKIVALSALAVVATSCGGDDPQPNPDVVSTYTFTGGNDYTIFNKTDSSFTVYQKVRGTDVTKDAEITAVVSASKKAKGDPISFYCPLLAESNINQLSNSVTDMRELSLKDYKLGTQIFSDGKNIGQTSDKLGKIDKIDFSENYGVFAKNTNNKQEIIDLLKNKDVSWKLTGQSAIINKKTYTLIVN